MTAIIASIVYKTIVDGKWEKLIRFEIGRLAERIAVQRGEKKKKKRAARAAGCYLCQSILDIMDNNVIKYARK